MKDFLLGSIGKIDGIIYALVALFFCSFALACDGDVKLSFIGAGGVIFAMLLISFSVETIIETLKNVKGIGTITGFITNGPELICLLAGLMAGDVLFAASTPLGSNVMNPLLLIVAALVCRVLAKTAQDNPRYSLICLVFTISLALSFYKIPQSFYGMWVAGAIIVTGILFWYRPKEEGSGQVAKVSINRYWLVPAIIILCAVGYFLDSVVSFASENSNAPKGIIGFIVLATLTSWPEFKSTLSLLSRNEVTGSILNVMVSNITNIWLAALGVTYWLAQ